MKSNQFVTRTPCSAYGILIDPAYVDMSDSGWGRFDYIKNEGIKNFIISNRDIQNGYLIVGGNPYVDEPDGIGIISSYLEVPSAIDIVNSHVSSSRNTDADGDTYIRWETICDKDLKSKFLELLSEMYIPAKFRRAPGEQNH